MTDFFLSLGLSYDWAWFVATICGILLIALGAAWGHVRLSPAAERWAVGLLAFGSLANWLATLLAAIWGAGGETMPLTAAGHKAAAWQESVVTGLLRMATPAWRERAADAIAFEHIAQLCDFVFSPHEPQGAQGRSVMPQDLRWYS